MSIPEPNLAAKQSLLTILIADPLVIEMLLRWLPVSLHPSISTWRGGPKNAVVFCPT